MCSQSRLHIYALGSSFAAGPGIFPRDPASPRAANRSSRNYAHLLAGKLNAALTDLSVSGATLHNVLSEPQQARKRFRILPAPSFQPQLSQLAADADIVTMTAGGNDMCYTRGLHEESYRAALLRRGPPARHVPPLYVGKASAGEVTQRLIAVIDAVLARAPRATVVLVEYPAIVGDATKPGAPESPLSREQINHYRCEGEALAEAFREAAASRPGTVVVRMTELSRGHEVGSPEPWVSGFSFWRGAVFKTAQTFHPNAAAHVAAAEHLYEAVKAARSR